MGTSSGAPSEAAVEAVREAMPDLFGGEYSDWATRELLKVAHDAEALGLDRSVNERWCREDQTRQITAWLRSDPPPFASREWCKQAADVIEARFAPSPALEDTDREGEQ